MDTLDTAPVSPLDMLLKRFHHGARTPTEPEPAQQPAETVAEPIEASPLVTEAPPAPAEPPPLANWDQVAADAALAQMCGLLDGVARDLGVNISRLPPVMAPTDKHEWAFVCQSCVDRMPPDRLPPGITLFLEPDDALLQKRNVLAALRHTVTQLHAKRDPLLLCPSSLDAINRILHRWATGQ